MYIDAQHRWVPRVVHRAALFLTHGRLPSPWPWTCSRLALALSSPVGRSQVGTIRPAGVQVNAFNRNRAHSQINLPSTCASRSLSQDTQVEGLMRLHGCRSPDDVDYETEDDRAVICYRSVGASVRFAQEVGKERAAERTGDAALPAPGES